MKFYKHAKDYISILHKVNGFILGCGAISAFVSCSLGNSLAIDNSTKVLSVKNVYGVFNGTIVKVMGKFEGWSPCSDNTILKTRSDWTLASDGRCIYVTGKRPKGAQQGEIIVIKAMVILEDDKAYLQYLDK